MLEKRELVFEVDGEGVSPETVKVRELFPLLLDFESAVLATARDSGAGDGDDLGFTLKDVEKGSDRLFLCASQIMYRATETVADAIDRDYFANVPKSAHGHLRNFSKKARKKNWSVSIYSHRDAKFPHARMPPDKELLFPHEAEGRTSILAFLNRVGNETDPTANLILTGGEKVTARVGSRALAKELGGRLFQMLVLDGDVIWDVQTWTLKDFTIRSIGEFEDTKAVEAFRQLSEVAGNHWDDIDPLEYVRDIRAD